MRKYILPLLVAGAVAFTAAQAMATSNYSTGVRFTEEHAIVGGVVTHLGNHYKVSDLVETGAHGTGNDALPGYGAGDTFQLNSAILKTLGVTADGDASWGFTTGANPFVQGMMSETDLPLPAPKFSQPCPEWATNATGSGTSTKGTCQANVYATDPQTEDSALTWDGIILDDLYSATGAIDNNGELTNIVGVNIEERFRTLDQNLDQVFLNGKTANNGLVTTVGTATMSAVTGKRYFNINDTLDQDLADWVTIHVGTSVTAKDETMGIYGKLTLVFQLAGEASSVTGCASKAAEHTAGTNNGINACAPFVTATTGSGYSAAAVGEAPIDMAAWDVNQLLISDAWDWGYAAGATDKAAGTGIKTNYTSWFNDGHTKAFNYSHSISGGHGSRTDTYNANGHTQPDP